MYRNVLVKLKLKINHTFHDYMETSKVVEDIDGLFESHKSGSLQI